MLWRLPVALAQVKPGNESGNALNEIRQILYSLHQVKEITKKVYDEFNKGLIQTWNYIYEFTKQ